ncbi:MAG TPA: hypothetical protein PLY96_06450 [Chromatiaceae bacterium]|nr:hypothetical protein [Chromatiaceae bacterium]
MKKTTIVLVWLLVAACQSQAPREEPAAPQAGLAGTYERTRLADDIFEVKCRKEYGDPEKDRDICTLNAIVWALGNGYPYFVELEPEFIETGEGHPEPLTSDQWVRITLWGLRDNPGVLRFMYDGAQVAENLSRKYRPK